ncbi:glycoside hydrolase, partial [Pseudomassariella vexata]
TTASIKQAASQVAEDLLTFYHGDEPGNVPGILPGPPPDGPYYWWIGGALWGTLLDYRLYTGDTKYDDIIMEAMTHQVGDDKDFMPLNWTASMGNDDQAFWAFAALIAVESRFTNPPEDSGLDWLALAQAVFNEQTLPERRVATENCKDGLRWQVFSFNTGWDYVNTIANAAYFNIGARLARYTDNGTYAEVAGDTWDWLTSHGYIDDQGNVYDGAHEPKDCRDINQFQFSYNAAVLIQGAAFLYNMTEGSAQELWKSRIDLLLNRTLTAFFPNGTAVEFDCERGKSCTVDMKSFKGYLHRWLASTTILATYTAPKILPVLRTSTEAAVAQCTGGNNQRQCGFRWETGVFDPDGFDQAGAVQQMDVLGALLSLLVTPDAVPVTNSTGGTSKGDSGAGSSLPQRTQYRDITAADRAGAAILTVVLLISVAVVFGWMSFWRD